MKIKNICIIADGYPSEKNIKNAFLEELINKFIDYDINCYVIAPQSLTKILIRGYPKSKKRYNRINENGKSVMVYAPYYFSFSNVKKIINTNKVKLYSFEKSVKKIYCKLSKKIKFDLIYAQVIFPSAIVANKIGKKYNIPVFFAYGENTRYTIDYLGAKKTRKLLQGITGVISVSKENKKRLVENCIVADNQIKIFPNATNKKIFYKKNKQEMRAKFGYDNKEFIVAFVGRFISSKGIERLCEALNLINNPNIKAIFIGKGNIKPKYNNIIFEGTVDHKKIVDYLSASDVFVLPTTAEGCCNAILEAISCGLPVISSKDSFNDEILDDNCSIRINSMNVEEIKNAIYKLYKDNELRKKLSIGALKKSQEFNIENRAKQIIKFMKDSII